MSNKGYLLIANNNANNDYVKQAIFCAQRIKKFCNNASVSVITSDGDYLRHNDNASVFDNIIDINYQGINNRIIFDGALSYKTVNWKNVGRHLAYELTPYDETILLDTDYIFCNNSLDNCFGSASDIMLYKQSKYIGNEQTEEFNRCSDEGIDFYWATVIYFKKSILGETLFELVSHIKDNWYYYNNLYQIKSPNFRNDYAFSIAVHTLNKMQNKYSVVGQLPGKMYYAKDQDFLEKVDDDKMVFLIGKKDHLGEYTLCSTEGLNTHVLNKASLERQIG